MGKHRFTGSDGVAVNRKLTKTDLMWVALLRDTSCVLQSAGGMVCVGGCRLLYSEFEALCEEADGNIPLFLAGLRDYESRRPRVKTEG